jgi:hypothetical protein
LTTGEERAGADLLDIDLSAGKQWIDLVVEEMRAQRLAETRVGRRTALKPKQVPTMNATASHANVNSHPTLVSPPPPKPTHAAGTCRNRGLLFVNHPGRQQLLSSA